MHFFVIDYKDVTTLDNKFKVIYDNTSYFNASGQIKYQLKEKIHFLAKGNYHLYKTENLTRAYHKPSFDLTFSGIYNLKSKIILKADVYVIGDQWSFTQVKENNVYKTEPKLLKSVGDINELKTNIMNLTVGQDFAATIDDAQACLDTSVVNLDVADACEIERRFWPAKLVGVEVPTFIVAIRPKWAQHFFDADLGSQLLFGLREDLHLGVEGVYYRSAENNNLAAPGRILWYVSKGDGIGSMCIKAYSQLEEVIIGKPKDLFRRFQRLGIYEWNDVYAVANNDTDRNIVAFRFRMTERFKTPVDMKFLESIDIRGPFMSPRKITDTQFACIYSKGTTLT